MGEDRGDTAASRKPSGGREENGKHGFLFPWEQKALSLVSILICTFAGAVTIVAVFTRNAADTLVFSFIAVAAVVLGIVGIYRGRRVLRRRLRVPAYLILLAFIAVLAAGFASHSLWPGGIEAGLFAGEPGRERKQQHRSFRRFTDPRYFPDSDSDSEQPGDEPFSSRQAGGVCRWDLSGTRCSTILTDPDWYNGGPWNSAISGDASTVAYQDSNGTGMDVVNVATGGQVAHFTDPDGAQLMGANYGGNNVPGSAVSLDEDGRVLTAGDADGNLYVWDVGTNQLLATLHFNPTAAMKDLAPAAILSPDGRTVLIPDGVSGLQSTLWNIGTKANVTPADALWPKNWHSSTGSVFFTSDGQGIVTYRDDNSGADLWNATTRAHIASVPFTGSYFKIP